MRDVLSSQQEIKTGVSQSSISDPLIFSCYLLPLELIFKQLQINYHFYADDTVIYFVYEETVTHEKIDLIINSLQKWFRGAKSKLNTSKADSMRVVRKISFNADLRLSTDSKLSDHVKFLGFIIWWQTFSNRAKQFSYFCLLL